jgi:hypothetical protein
MPRDEIPGDSAEKAGKNHIRVHLLNVEETAADRFRHRGAKANAAMKFQNAAQATPCSGVRTRVETTVAMEFAAS